MMKTDELQTIADRILEVAKLIDHNVEEAVSKSPETYAIPFHSRLLLTFKYGGLKVNKVDVRHIDIQSFINIYDNLIVLLPDFIIIRSIRYRGKSKLLMEPFVVSKFTIEKAKTRLGEELTGSFITYGNIKSTTINPLQSQIIFSTISNMIRPLARVKRSGETFIFPSPLSLTSLKLGRSAEQNIIYLAPSSSIPLIDYRDAAHIKTSILGEHVEGFKAPAYFISCKFSQEDIPTPKCAPVGPFMSFTPIVSGLTDELVEYAGNREAVLANLLGILILGSGLICSSRSRSCYLLALSPGVPYIPEIEVMSLLGEPVEITWERGGSSLKLHLYLRVKKTYVEAFSSKVAKTIENLVRQFNAVDEVRISNQIINSMKNALIWEDQNHIYMPVPPLLRDDITTVKDIERKIIGSPAYPLLDHELRRIMPRFSLVNMWLPILNEVRNIIDNHPLGIIV